MSVSPAIGAKTGDPSNNQSTARKHLRARIPQTQSTDAHGYPKSPSTAAAVDFERAHGDSFAPGRAKHSIHPKNGQDISHQSAFTTPASARQRAKKAAIHEEGFLQSSKKGAQEPHGIAKEQHDVSHARPKRASQSVSTDGIEQRREDKDYALGPRRGKREEEHDTIDRSAVAMLHRSTPAVTRPQAKKFPYHSSDLFGPPLGKQGTRHEDVLRARPDTHVTHSPAKKKSKDPNQRKAQHATKPPDKKIVCTNNALDKRLRENGGPARLGKRSECFRRGFGAGYYQKLHTDEVDAFLAKWHYTPYRKLIEQDLFYADGEAPNGRIPATLPQSVSRGFAVGSKKKAERLAAQIK